MNKYLECCDSHSKANGAEAIIGVVVLLTFWVFIAGDVNAIFRFIGWPLVIIGFIALLVWFFDSMQTASIRKDLGLDFKKLDQSTSKQKPINRAAVSTLEPGQLQQSWSHELIDEVEWRVFEKISIGLWQAKGFEIEETANGADGGVDFYLCAKGSKVRIGAVQCKSWKSKQIDVKVIRELQGVVAVENLKLGLVMYSGKLTKAANDFINKPTVTIKSQGTKQIFEQIQQLDSERQQQLLDDTIVGEYLTPTCPSCDVKLVTRTAKKTGNEFKGCPNFPRCRYTIY